MLNTKIADDKWIEVLQRPWMICLEIYFHTKQRALEEQREMTTSQFVAYDKNKKPFLLTG